MNKSTQTTGTSNPTSYGFCSWHQRFAADVRLINHVEQGSGAGGVQYACGPCREQYRLVPSADQP
ncbi:hypothetical protein [Streptomyces sp. MH13]|uniref:hypothetical protein n=1 Tax=Streptomyces sp. MH13 TaxID=3417651 RepID=UPI003CE8B6A2